MAGQSDRERHGRRGVGDRAASERVDGHGEVSHIRRVAGGESPRHDDDDPYELGEFHTAGGMEAEEAHDQDVPVRAARWNATRRRVPTQKRLLGGTQLARARDESCEHEPAPPEGSESARGHRYSRLQHYRVDSTGEYILRKSAPL